MSSSLVVDSVASFLNAGDAPSGDWFSSVQELCKRADAAFDSKVCNDSIIPIHYPVCSPFGPSRLMYLYSLSSCSILN